MMIPDLTEFAVAAGATMLALIFVLSIPSALEAILNARTPQGAIAWAISLLTFAPLAVPMYLIFGRSKFDGYLEKRDEVEARALQRIRQSSQKVEQYVVPLSPATPLYSSLYRLARVPATSGNQVDLLIDGQATFDSITDGLERAQKFILFQFYIVRDDTLGRLVGRILAEKARSGIPVYFIYDEVGSTGFRRSALHRLLTDAGVRLSAFNTTRGRRNRFQLNFRNHRKVVVVDGSEAWIGGLNVGDEYLGLGKKMGYWRDTHVRFSGPSVLAAQLAFATDWHWATREDLVLGQDIVVRAEGNCNVLVFPSDPASEYEEAGLMFHQIIAAARERIWIASPYFVPDGAIISALQLAALRGVDVRLILPRNADHFVVGLARWDFIRKLLPAGIKVYLYKQGFLHQKVFLLDQTIAGVGTANCDNRSFRLNFEITVLVEDMIFASQVETMLEEDLTNCHQVEQADLDNQSIFFELGTGIARLFAPVL